MHGYRLAKFSILSESKEEKLILSSIKNIGGGGACLRIEKPLPVDTILNVHIHDPKAHHILRPRMAKVIWLKKLPKLGVYEAGIKFVQPDDTSR